MRSRLRPAAAKNSGNRPQAMPSFRLLTRPAWLMLDRLRSVKRRAPEDLARADRRVADAA